MDDRYIDVGGISIRYVSKGKGPEILLFHGLGEFLETWWGNIDSLSQYYTVYALDLPGHGLSQKPEVSYTLDFSTSFALGFMEALGIKQASLIGHSVTASLCLNLAIKFTEKVDTIILVGGTSLSRKEASFLYRLVTVLGKLISEPTKTDIITGVKRAFYNPDIVTEELVNKAYQYLIMSKTKEALLNVLRSNVDGQSIKPEVILADRLHLVRSPTLIVHGVQDRVIPVEHGQDACNLIPEARLKVFDECGHCPHIEKPEEFNQAVIAFLGG
jgi:4,5:9,10-diseco-3-hydroxy-5,9,17-trioxoandrosta-1(10),2-diene-4-oate hydrolase